MRTPTNPSSNQLVYNKGHCSAGRKDGLILGFSVKAPCQLDWMGKNDP